MFTEPRAHAQLPAARVLAHIRAVDTRLVVPYLEHVIGEESSDNADFHNELAFQYLDTVQRLRAGGSGSSPSSSSPSSSASSPSSSPMARAGQEAGLLGETRRKLLEFLENSAHYNPPKMLSRFPHSDLFEERAILLSKIGQHEAALEIYAHRLNDFRMAEEYCARHYDKNADARDVYLSLLRVYLRPPPPAVPMIKPALALLKAHFGRIDTPKALDMLPVNVSIKQLLPFFRSVLRADTETRRNSQIIHSLVKSENLQVHEQLIAARSRAIVINEGKPCPVCKKRLGTSVFASYPNGVVVHYICCQDKSICPVTRTNFADQS
jgi:Vam6/Vps39-like protein vacuolar protein sorting-associated protein 39